MPLTNVLYIFIHAVNIHKTNKNVMNYADSIKHPINGTHAFSLCSFKQTFVKK